ncbi:MAG: Gldg family protein [Clostridia bacterium]|nr:Gldg family protein [Clostridia bacterium]
MWKVQIRMKKSLLATALTVLVVLALLVANLAFTALAQQNNLFVDTTTEGRYSLRPRMVEILKEANMQADVDIIFCAEDDILRSNYNTSLVYIMALELEKQVRNIHVSCVDATRHPELVAAYRRTSATTIKWNDVIISSGTEYRVYNTKSFFTVSSEDENEILGFNGEQKMCEAILSLTAKDLPLACFTVGNGEVLPSQGDEETGYLFECIRDAGFRVTAVDLETEDIPSDCAVLILNGPTEDYASGRLEDMNYNSPITKIDRFLDQYGTVFYFRNTAAGTLPNLEEFLAEWGIGFTVKDSAGNLFPNTVLSDSASALSGDPNRICGTYGDSSIYEDITALSSPPKTVFESAAPLRILWQDGISSINSAGRKVSTLFSTGSKAQALDDSYSTVKTGTFPLMTMTSETRIVDSEYYTATLFVCATDLYHSASYMADNVYANREVLQSALRGAARTTVSVAEELEFKYYESTDFTTSYDQEENTILKRDENGKVIWTMNPETGVSERHVIRIIRPIEANELTAWTVVLILLPLAALVVTCAVMTLRRKNR